MEDLLGSLLLTTVNRNGPRISPRGVEIPELNAALMSAGECVLVRFTSQFFVLDKSKSIRSPIGIGGQTVLTDLYLHEKNIWIRNALILLSLTVALHDRASKIGFAIPHTATIFTPYPAIPPSRHPA